MTTKRKISFREPIVQEEPQEEILDSDSPCNSEDEIEHVNGVDLQVNTQAVEAIVMEKAKAIPMKKKAKKRSSLTKKIVEKKEIRSRRQNYECSYNRRRQDVDSYSDSNSMDSRISYSNSGNIEEYFENIIQLNSIA